MLLLQVKDLIRRKQCTTTTTNTLLCGATYPAARAVQIQQLEVHMQMRIPFHG